ncbi:MAG TPA: M42 family metallopeptidase [Candidatus Spyradocola merdavium]|nr:M42 family metallopeptidase [Candidatus Spyradocola merdavium]
MHPYTTVAVDHLMKLVNIPSPSGFTHIASAYLMDVLSGYGFAPYTTHKGNVVCCIGGQGHPLVVAAHVDTLGAMVRSIKPNGRLRYTQIGGYPDNNLENETCVVHTRDGRTYTGTFYLTTPASHVYKDIPAVTRGDTTLEVVLDENVSSKDEVRALGIEVGDFISLDPRAVHTPSGYIKSRHLDDKASASVLLALAKMAASSDLTLSRKIYLVFTVHEEVGHGCCAGLPEDVEDILSVDMGCVGDDLTCDETMVSICAKDSRGPYNYEMTGRLIELAKDNNLKYAVDVYPMYASDADASLFSGHNFRHALIGPGVFASHGYERTHVSGLDNTLKLLAAFVSG